MKMNKTVSENLRTILNIAKENGDTVVFEVDTKGNGNPNDVVGRVIESDSPEWNQYFFGDENQLKLPGYDNKGFGVLTIVSEGNKRSDICTFMDGYVDVPVRTYLNNIPAYKNEKYLEALSGIADEQNKFRNGLFKRETFNDVNQFFALQRKLGFIRFRNGLKDRFDNLAKFFNGNNSTQYETSGGNEEHVQKLENNLADIDKSMDNKTKQGPYLDLDKRIKEINTAREQAIAKNAPTLSNDKSQLKSQDDMEL